MRFQQRLVIDPGNLAHGGKQFVAATVCSAWAFAFTYVMLALINLEDAEALRGLEGPTGIRLKFHDVLKAPERVPGASKQGQMAQVTRSITPAGRLHPLFDELAFHEADRGLRAAALIVRFLGADPSVL